MCERRCVCNLKSCKYCLFRNRYEREIPLRLHRASIRALHEKYRLEDSMLVLDAFIDGRLSLRDLELVLDAN
jgi:hypothetical protein